MLKTLLSYFLGPKGLAYTVFLALGMAGLCTLVPVVLANLGHTPDPRVSLGISVSTTCLVIGLVELATRIIQTLREGRDLPLFKQFFGEDVCRNDGVPTVFLQAELPPFPETSDMSPANNIVLTDPPIEAGNTKPKGIGHIIVFEDLEAVLAIDREFRKFGAQLQMVIDTFKSKPLPENGCIAIGLGYNNVTLRLMKLCPDLFEVTYDEVSDDFRLGNGDTGDGEPCDDYALIARVLLGSSRQAIPYIICAGHTAGATIVACEFLARNWRQLAYLYKQKVNPRRLNECNMAVILRFENKAKETPRLGTPWFTLIGQKHIQTRPNNALQLTPNGLHSSVTPAVGSN